TAQALRSAGYAVRTPDRAAFADLAPHMSGADAVISCLASRTGTPKDAWHVDHALNSAALTAAQDAGVGQFVLLSAICVQKPKLAFQQAKLAFEAELQSSGLTYSIIRPTAFFKSLSGQIDRVRAGKPFLVFGDGTLTACKPISDRDLGSYLVRALDDPAMQGRILPIGGPGPAITPLDQAAMLSEALGQDVPIKHVPPRLLTTIATGLGLIGLRTKSQLARIGHYYATESMLVWDGTRYDADATPEFGQDTLADHYRALVRGQITDDRGAHAVF
ncbi:MAG: NAD(P)H-binding protein, partial [Pseudomonadota bacterium]